jgi:hypothetical protein
MQLSKNKRCRLSVACCPTSARANDNTQPAIIRGTAMHPPDRRHDQPRMVGVPGVEPGTLSLSGTRSNQLSYTPSGNPNSEFGISNFELPARSAGGGGNRVRTGDPELAKLVLCQLSYAPGLESQSGIPNSGSAHSHTRSARRLRSTVTDDRSSHDQSPLAAIAALLHFEPEAVRPAGLAPDTNHTRPAGWAGRAINHRRPTKARQLLLRKEVIQPQVPLRLPCYDFIPITTHTFGAQLPCGLHRRLRVQTAFMM